MTRRRGRPWRTAFSWLACATLVAGCAGQRLAPVEERGAVVTVPGTTPAGDGTGPPGVTVSPLPDSGPAGGGGPVADARAPAASAPAPPSPAPPSPAVVALLNRANADAQAGRHGSAAASLERAIRIEPQNAWLWHRLAVARLEQGRAGEAASLAARSNALAGADNDLRAGNWRLIARVHRQRGERVAAEEAERRARELVNPAS